MLFVIGCDDTDALDNIIDGTDGIDVIQLSEDGMLEGSFQFSGIIIYENTECSGTAITSVCNEGDGDFGEISEAQCDSLGGSMIPLIDLFTNGDPTCAPYIIFASDGSFINPDCETFTYTIDSTYTVQIDESECEDQDGNDIENITTQAACDSVGGNWELDILDGFLNTVDGSVTINGTDEGGCDNDEYVNENDCYDAGYDWEDPECYQYTLTYAPDHDGTCTGEDLCDDGSDGCESDDDCEDGEECLDGECNFFECQSSDLDCGTNQECVDGVCIDLIECDSDEDCEVYQQCDGVCVDSYICTNNAQLYSDYIIGLLAGTATALDCQIAMSGLLEWCEAGCEYADGYTDEDQICTEEFLGSSAEDISLECAVLHPDNSGFFLTGTFTATSFTMYSTEDCSGDGMTGMCMDGVSTNESACTEAGQTWMSYLDVIGDLSVTTQSGDAAYCADFDDEIEYDWYTNQADCEANGSAEGAADGVWYDASCSAIIWTESN